MTDIRKMPIPQDSDQYLADLRRSRQHGVDINDDHERGRSGNFVFRSVAYGAALLLATAVLYEATNAAQSETDHAPQAPVSLVDNLHGSQPK